MGESLEPRGGVDPVTHEVAMFLLDHVADMDADAKDEAFVLGHSYVSLRHRVLEIDRAAHGVDGAAELDERSVAEELDDAAAMLGNRGIEEVAAQGPEPGAERSQPRRRA